MQVMISVFCFFSWELWHSYLQLDVVAVVCQLVTLTCDVRHKTQSIAIILLCIYLSKA